MKNTVLCPNPVNHKDRDKILMAFDLENKRFWVHCFLCRRWVEININDSGGVTTTPVPSDWHFNFKQVASIVKGNPVCSKR